eukprot:Phypoly_transcript_00318.p1 GENE.Phypoly_transcript_00318~~Phypoly_transcript_00318.p1  ORF type:complete len:1709 (+),score=182.92 Phypoly_transcript_00318:71-5197(+)
MSPTHGRTGSTIVCRRCGCAGHLAMDCDRKNACVDCAREDKLQCTHTCFTCNRVGHKAALCPQAYIEQGPSNHQSNKASQSNNNEQALEEQPQRQHRFRRSHPHLRQSQSHHTHPESPPQQQQQSVQQWLPIQQRNHHSNQAAQQIQHQPQNQQKLQQQQQYTQHNQQHNQQPNQPHNQRLNQYRDQQHNQHHSQQHSQYQHLQHNHQSQYEQSQNQSQGQSQQHNHQYQNHQNHQNHQHRQHSNIDSWLAHMQQTSTNDPATCNTANERSYNEPERFRKNIDSWNTTTQSNQLQSQPQQKPQQSQVEWRQSSHPSNWGKAGQIPQESILPSNSHPQTSSSLREPARSSTSWNSDLPSQPWSSQHQQWEKLQQSGRSTQPQVAQKWDPLPQIPQSAAQIQWNSAPSQSPWGAQSQQKPQNTSQTQWHSASSQLPWEAQSQQKSQSTLHTQLLSWRDQSQQPWGTQSTDINQTQSQTQWAAQKSSSTPEPTKTSGMLSPWNSLQKVVTNHASAQTNTPKSPAKPQEYQAQANHPFKPNTNNNELPITEHREAILSAIRENQVVIISGATGSGKTTQVPKFILEEYRSASKFCNIVCTQPRRLAATSIAKRVAEEIGEEVGQTVGYQIGMDRQASDKDTQLLFVTTGVMLKKLVNNKSLEQYTHIILDEVHERDLDTDFALVVIKKLLTSYPTVRLILMSATFNCELFINYFPLQLCHKNPPLKYKLVEGDTSRTKSNAGAVPPLLSVGGHCYPVEVVYLENIVEILAKKNLAEPYPNFDNLRRDETQPVVESNHLLIATHVILQIQEGLVSEQFDFGPKEDNAVLVFLPGLGEILEMKDMLSQFDVSSLWIIPLHSSVTSDEQAQVFKKAPHRVRKVILATNIAESSVTVPDIRYVIDLGFVKEIFYDPQTNLESLKLQYASKASAIQRQGRAGRVGPGFVFRIYTQEFYDCCIPDYSPSEMLRCPLESLVLHIKVMNEEVQLLDKAIQPPNLEFLNQALLNLRNAGGLDNQENITFLGRLFSALPLDIKLSKLLLLGHIFGVSEEIIDIAANISLRGIFTRSFNQPLSSFAKKLEWSQGSESDSIAAWIALSAFKNTEFQGRYSSRDYCRQNFLHYNTVQELTDLTQELNIRLNSHFKPNAQTLNQPQKLNMLKIVLFSAFYPNYYVGDFGDKREFQSWPRENIDPIRSILVSGLPNEVSEAKVQELLSSCGEVSQVSLRMGHKAYVEFNSNGNPKKAITLAIKMGLMRKLVMSASNSPLPAEIYSKGNSHPGNKRGGRRKDRDDIQDEYTLSEGYEVSLPYLVPTNWGIKVIQVPSHPFKINFEAQNFQTVTIDAQSVNSVAVDHSDAAARRLDPEDAEGTPTVVHRYLAAAFVSSGGSWNEKQLARETTLLPTIPLIGPILAMIFCPVPEMHLWPNKRRTHYLGVSMHDNTLSFSFTHVFTQGDLDSINDMREQISKSLTQQGIKEDNSVVLRTKLWRILDRKRRPLRVRRRPTSVALEHPTYEGEQMLLMPIIPSIPLVPCTEEDEYDSDQEEKAKKKKTADEIRNRFAQVEQAQKFVACITCREPIAALPTLESHEDEREGGFRLTRTFGMAYTITDDPGYFGCRNLHRVGLCSDNDYYIDSQSPLCVLVPGCDPLPWNEQMWKNNFAAIGGPHVQAEPEKQITREDLFCTICNYQANDKRGFLYHINSRSHSEEEKWFISSMS